MTRFVDYICLIGIKELAEDKTGLHDVLDPAVLTQIPHANWWDFKFPEQLPFFCYPDGWSIRACPIKPRIFCNALTDLDGNRCYYASLIFYRAFNTKKLYYPCALTIISRMPYFSNFKQCLTIIFNLIIKPNNNISNISSNITNLSNSSSIKIARADNNRSLDNRGSNLNRGLNNNSNLDNRESNFNSNLNNRGLDNNRRSNFNSGLSDNRSLDNSGLNNNSNLDNRGSNYNRGLDKDSNLDNRGSNNNTVLNLNSNLDNRGLDNNSRLNNNSSTDNKGSNNNRDLEKQLKNNKVLSQILYTIVFNNHSTKFNSKQFKLNLGDYVTVISPPLSPLIPTSDDCALTLLRLIGIHNLTTLYSAILLDNKIVFLSKSYTYLYKCTRGLISLIYPIKFMYVYIPILPSSLTEILNAPTPYLVGIHSSCDIDMTELGDVVFMNLDLGLLIKSEGCDIPPLPQPHLGEIQGMLVNHWHPELEFIDNVFIETSSLKEDVLSDKYIRAIFFYFNLKLLAGYRPCTTFARFVPVPIMKFHPSLFLSRRGINNCKFFSAFFKTTSFAEFINERGPTYRIDDYFDEMINHFGYDDNKDQNLFQLKLIDQFASYFLDNEIYLFKTASNSLNNLNTFHSPNSVVNQLADCSDSSLICSPSSVSGHNRLINPISDQFFDPVNIPDYCKKPANFDYYNLDLIDLDFSSITPPPDFNTPTTDTSNDKHKMIFDVSLFQHDLVYYINPRHQLMISQCISLIFKDKMSEALKFMYAVEQSLTSKACKYELMNAILKYMGNERTVLSSTQINAFVRLFNFILTNDQNETCYSPAVQIIKISSNFCQVNSDTAQFLYVNLQNHKIWKNIEFWVNMYFYEAQACLVGLYQRTSQETVNFQMNILRITSNDVVLHPQLKNTVEALDSSAHISADFEKQGVDERKTLEMTEMSFLYSLTIDFLDKMACMLIRYELFKEAMSKMDGKKESAQNALIKLKEDEMKEVSAFMNNFLFKINRYVCLKNDQLTSLQELSKNIVQSQIDVIEKVCSIKLPTLAQDLTKRFRPLSILENENLVSEIAGYIFYDISKPDEYDSLGSLSLFPAQGILYLTNKRLAFVGQSINPFLSDNTIFVSIPAKSLYKFKVCDAALTEFMDMKFTTCVHIKSQICHCFQFALTLSTQNDSLDAFKKIVRTQISQEQHKGGKIPTQTKKLDLTHKRENSLTTHRGHPPSDGNIGQQFSPPSVRQSVFAPNVTPQISHNTQTPQTPQKAEKPRKSDKFNTIRKKLKPESNSSDTLKGTERKATNRNSLLVEFARMNLVKNDQKKKVLWRVSALNHNFRCSSNIPEMFIVPLFVQDDLYMNIVKIFRRKRVPVCTFVHGISEDYDISDAKVYALFRSEAPLKTIHAPAAKGSSKATEISHILGGMITTIDSLRQEIFHNLSLLEFINKQIIDLTFMVNISNLEIFNWHTVPLYIFYDRNFGQSNLIEKMSCVNIDYLSVLEIKKSFAEFQRAFFPLASKGKTTKPVFETINDSKWFRNVRHILILTTTASFLGDVCTSSSYFSFGDGVDITSVLMSVTQILIDPFYRTVLGFQRLIEKEWFEFNYNFYGKNFIEFIPIFLLFLDCLYQLTQQFPYAFEYNTYFLSFIAYHNFSCKFNNFLQGNAIIDSLTDEMMDNATLQDDISFDLNYNKGSTPSNFDFDSDMNDSSTCIFKYILRYVECSTVFLNPYFDQYYKGIIYPSSDISILEIWPFYYAHNFQLICMYNLETIPPHLINMTSSNSDDKSRSSVFKPEAHMSDCIQNHISNTIMTYGYTGDGTPFVNDSIGWLMYEIMNLRYGGRTIDYITHPLLAMPSFSYFPTSNIASSNRFHEFMLHLSYAYKITEAPKNIKAEGEKADPNLHELLRFEGFYPSYCYVCGLCQVSTNQFYYCNKCGVFIHFKCQPYSSMLCQSRFKTVGNISNEDFDVQSHESPAPQLTEDDLILQGFLYTKKLLSSWAPKYYVFNKKNQTLNVYNTTDTNSLPIQSYGASQISNCKELKTIPTNIPKDLQHVAGAFELKIKKKCEVFLTSKKSEATTWVRVLSKYVNG